MQQIFPSPLQRAEMLGFSLGIDIDSRYDRIFFFNTKFLLHKFKY